MSHYTNVLKLVIFFIHIRFVWITYFFNPKHTNVRNCRLILWMRVGFQNHPISHRIVCVVRNRLLKK